MIMRLLTRSVAFAVVMVAECKAPKTRFMMANASVEEMLDTTKEDDAVSRGSGEMSGSPPNQN